MGVLLVAADNRRWMSWIIANFSNAPSDTSRRRPGRSDFAMPSSNPRQNASRCRQPFSCAIHR